MIVTAIITKHNKQVVYSSQLLLLLLSFARFHQFTVAALFALFSTVGATNVPILFA